MQEPLGRHVDPGDTLEDEITDGGREVGPASCGNELLDEERIAVGAIGDGVEEPRRWCGPGELTDQLSDLERPQRAERHLPRPSGADELTEGDRQTVGTVTIGWPPRCGDHHGRRPNRVGDEQQQVTGGFVGPLEILDDDHQRLRRGCGDKLVGDPGKEPEAVGRVARQGNAADPALAGR